MIIWSGCQSSSLADQPRPLQTCQERPSWEATLKGKKCVKSSSHHKISSQSGREQIRDNHSCRVAEGFGQWQRDWVQHGHHWQHDKWGFQRHRKYDLYKNLGLFDKDKSGEICYTEFGALWRYVVDWQNCFKAFDKYGQDWDELRTDQRITRDENLKFNDMGGFLYFRDKSGTINQSELQEALTTFGYNLSPQVQTEILL